MKGTPVLQPVAYFCVVCGPNLRTQYSALLIYSKTIRQNNKEAMAKGTASVLQYRHTLSLKSINWKLVFCKSCNCYFKKKNIKIKLRSLYEVLQTYQNSLICYSNSNDYKTSFPSLQLLNKWKNGGKESEKIIKKQKVEKSQK